MYVRVCTMSCVGARHLSGSHLPSDILYYEILDIPLEQLEMLKTIKVRGGIHIHIHSEHDKPRDAAGVDVFGMRQHRDQVLPLHVSVELPH